MSTNAHVAVRKYRWDGTETYRYIYNHHDSYIDGLGICLYQNYKDIGKVMQLIELGNTDSIRAEVGNSSESYAQWLESGEQETVAEVRDKCNRWHDYERTWEDEKPRGTDSLQEVLSQEFVYIFDEHRKEWDVSYHRGNTAVMMPLGELLHAKPLLEYFFSAMYREECLPAFYEKCLNA